MENEIWKDVPGYEGQYQISCFGNAKQLQRHEFQQKRKPRLIKEMILKPSIGRAGYLRISINSKKGRRQIYLHRAVAYAFISNPDGKKEINHIDGDKTNNHFSNLEWCTHRENIIHAIKTGLKKYGPLSEDHKKKLSANSPRAKMVKCTITGEIMSRNQASKKSGIPNTTLNAWLNGDQENKSQYINA